MDVTETVRLSVKEHYQFQPEHPERFDWSQVINGRHKELCELLAAEIVQRRAVWTNNGHDGVDPLIPGMQEALRVFSDMVIWRVQQVKTARPVTLAQHEEECLAALTPRSKTIPNPERQQQEVARKLR